MLELSLIQKITIWALPVLFAVTLHEVAHGWMASKLGDQTAKLSGRITLNPIKHVDLMGTIIVPLLLLSVSNFIFGWAKPVPVDGRNLRNPKRDMALVALAGPVSNLFMALCWGLIAKIGIIITPSSPWSGLPMVYMGQAGIMINVFLGILNLIPIPPLDGGKVLASLLSGRMAWRFYQLEPYGLIILMILIFSGLLSYILNPIIIFCLKGITQIIGLY